MSGAIVVSEILGTAAAGCSRSSRRPSQADRKAVTTVAEKIAAEVDRVLSAEQVLTVTEILQIEPKFVRE